MWSKNLEVKNNDFQKEEQFFKSNLDDLEFSIVKRLYTDCLPCFKNMESTDYGKSDKPWTNKVKEILTTLGKENNFLIFPNSDEGEWLFDVTWIDPGKSIVSEECLWMNEPKLILACESEWRSDHKYFILKDFLKLSFSNARIKLFIYTNQYFPRLNKSPVDFCRDSCCIQKAKYLLIGFPTIDQYREGNSKFIIDSFEK
ncbi:MAG: hypothetical protein ABSE00_10645 [Chitinispirillaceae bacterium]|jgi:hypothetical protein